MKLRTFKADFELSNEPDGENVLFHGDNVLAMHELIHVGCKNKFKCIYIDPPYNTGGKFKHYNDKRDNWLAFMRERLLLLHQLLANDGTFWVSIDDNEMHYLKIMLDEIFGCENFIATIVVSMNPKGRQMDRFFAGSHEYVLCYAKNIKACTLDPGSREEVNTNDFPLEDDIGIFRLLPLRNTNKRFNPQTCPNLYYPIYHNITTNEFSTTKNFSDVGNVIFPEFGSGAPAVWRWGREKLDRESNSLSVKTITRRGKPYVDVFQRDYCLADRKKKMKTIWLSDAIGSTDQAKKEIRNLFPDDVFATPKPRQLMKRIIEAATVPGDFVLDAFMGSGTTAIVAHELGRRWVGIENGEHAKTLCLTRIKDCGANFTFCTYNDES